MHSLETINRLNNEAHEKWEKKQIERPAQRDESPSQFLALSITQALSYTKSGEEIHTLLMLAKHRAEDIPVNHFFSLKRAGIIQSFLFALLTIALGGQKNHVNGIAWD